MRVVHDLVRISIGTCWGIVVLVWIAGAVYNASRGPHGRRRHVSTAGAGFVGVALTWAAFRAVPSGDWRSLTVGSLWVRFLGLAVLVAATAFTLWARVALGTMWSSTPTVKVDHELRTDGPYGITRHPIYTGLFGMLLGTVLLVGFGRWIAILAAGLIFVEARIRTEEALMLSTFPETYPGYRRRVPQLVPGLRRLRRSS